MQKITICGNLTKDPILNQREWINKETGEVLKASVCNFTVAADDRHDEYKKTEFFGVNVWRSFGEICADVLKKGDKVLVHGSIHLKKFIDKQNNMRANMEITPVEIEFMNGKTIKIDENTQRSPDDDGMDF